MRMKSNYAEIIKRHVNSDEGMMVHTIMALYINSHPEHKNAINARNYLEWVNGYNSKVIDGAYAAIQDLVSAGLATFTPAAFISDGRDVLGAIPPYPYLCTPDQVLHYSKGNQFWTDLK